ncbi:hypothetical protein Ancab_008073 [Ancistrocladus abbreviatus]
MAYEIPSDLINQVQILLRKEAGLECYNPDDSSYSLPDPPTLEESVAKFDQSPDHLRCEHCSGKLLRGDQSIICVYCGREQRKELPRPPLSFKSTVGFRWLLESLGLDGTEIVGLPIEDTRTNKGQSLSNNETILSNFLDLEMKWPDEMERFGITTASEKELLGKRILNLAGVVPGDFFPEAGRGTVLSISSEEFDPNETRKSKESTSFQGQGNLSLFENQQFSRGFVKPEVEQGDSFSGWAVDFQSSQSGTKNEDFKSPDPLKPSGVGYGSQMDLVFVPVMDLKEGRPADVLSSLVSGNNWTANDPWSISSPGESTQAEKPEANIVLQDNGMVSKSDNTPPTSFDCFRENQQQSSNSELPEGIKIVGDAFFKENKDFKSSTSEYSQCETNGTIVPDSEKSRMNDGASDAWANFTSSRTANDTQQQTTGEKVGEDISFDAWNDFTSSSIVQYNVPQTRSIDACEGKAASLDDYPAHMWSNFTSLSAYQTPQKAVGERNQDDSLGLWGDYTSSVSEGDHGQSIGAKSTANDATKKDDSTFGTWSDFMNTSVEQGTQPEINHIEVVDYNMASESHIGDVWDDFMILSNTGNNVKQNNTLKAFENMEIGKKDASDDAWNNFKSSSNASENKTMEGSTSMAWNNLASSVSLQQTSSEQAPENKKIVEDGDLLNSWGNFRSLGNAVDINLSSSTPVSDNSKDILLSSTIAQASQHLTGGTEALENVTAIEHEDLFNTWSDFRNEASVADDQRQTVGAEVSKNKMISESDDLLSNGLNDRLSNLANMPDNQLKSSGIAIVDNKICANKYSEDDDWTDFANSSTIGQNHCYNTSTNASDDKVTVKHSDPLDAWDVFNSSSGQIGNHPVASQQHSSEENLLSTTSNSQGVGLSTSWQQDIFSGALTNQSSSAPSDILPPEVSVLFRMNDDNAKAEATTEKGRESEEISQETSASKLNDTESLISQMHDLSFMLESSLSIPKS